MVDDFVSKTETGITNGFVHIPIISHGKVKCIVTTVNKGQQFFVALTDSQSVIVDAEPAFRFVDSKSGFKNKQHPVP